jgi:Putative bacterial sensory transduction regulator
VAAVDVVDAYVSALPAGGRRLAHAEWGITVPAESLRGEPLDVGLRIADGLLTAKALALPGAGDLDPWMVLWWNRQTRMVRFGCTQSQDIWVHADLPVAGVDEPGVDRLLGLVAEAATAVRDYATRSRTPAG